MKRILKIVLVAVVFMSVFSCSTSRYSYRVTGTEKTDVITNDVVVDVQIDLNKKINQTSSKQKTEQRAKDEAYYKAIVNNNIDIIVDPIYEVTKTFNKYTAKITGFAGYYKNARSKVSVIEELKAVDTLDIIKYDYIFGERLLKTKDSNIAILASGSSKESKMSKKRNNKSSEKFTPSKSFGLKLARSGNTVSFGGIEDDNPGFAFGFVSDNQFREKWGMRTEVLFSINEISNNLNIPILFNYGGKFKVYAGTSLTLNFKPKDLNGSGDDFFEEEILDFYREETPFANLGIDFGLSYSFTSKLAIESRSSFGLLGSDFNQSYLGLTYKFN